MTKILVNALQLIKSKIIYMRENINIYYLLYFILIFSTVFQDFFLFNYIGEFGRSITAIITIPIFIIYVVILRKKIHINKYLKILIKLCIYLLIINVIVLFLYIIRSNNLMILDENIIMQTAKGYMYFLSITIFMILLYNLQLKINNEQVFKPFAFTFIFLFFILIIELISKPNAWPMLHNTFPYYRVRLTTAESSWTSSIIVIYFAMSCYYYKHIMQNKVMSIASILMFIVFLITSTSKALIISVLLSIFMMIIIDSKVIKIIKDSNLKTKIIGMCILCIILTPLFTTIRDSVISDLNEYTSIVTRVYSILIGIVYILLNPLGTGNALYLLKYPKMLQEYIHVFDKINFKFNLSEIYSFINSNTSQNLSVKSAFIQYGLYWGTVGMIMIAIFLIKIYRNLFKNKDTKFTLIKFAYINIILLLITAISFDIKYEIWALFSTIIYLGECQAKYDDRKKVN